MHPQIRHDLGKARTLSRKLARRFFHAMIRFGPKLEKKQVLLGRFVDIGAELFAQSVTCARAQALIDAGEDTQQLLATAGFFCKDSRHRVARLFSEIRGNADIQGYALAKSMLK